MKALSLHSVAAKNVPFICPFELYSAHVMIHLFFHPQEVPQSPFTVKVDPSHDASKVKAEGPGLARTGTFEALSSPLVFWPVHTCLPAWLPGAALVISLPSPPPPPSPPAAGIESGKPTHFTVLTKGAGKAPLDVSFSAPVKDFDVIDNYDYSQTVKYTPSQQVSTALLAHAQL